MHNRAARSVRRAPRPPASGEEEHREQLASRLITSLLGTRRRSATPLVGARSPA